MKLETCVYSLYKIYPEHGKRVVRPDGKVHIFLSDKAFRSTELKRNRSLPYKEQKTYGQENVKKKKVNKTTHTLNRAVAGVSLEAILTKTNAANEANKAARAAKTALNKEKKPAPQMVKTPKPVRATAPPIGGKH
ncbi:unnamed protein product [Haemonchus placei]|uniref:Signal recognition particle protein Srp19 n=1 Tax=Haemonchus placei TaxID=6290 RepID=A0A0N4W7U1_HAEPC|nr:unnamed protein product [Haemonchus placei]